MWFFAGPYGCLHLVLSGLRPKAKLVKRPNWEPQSREPRTSNVVGIRTQVGIFLSECDYTLGVPYLGVLILVPVAEAFRHPSRRLLQALHTAGGAAGRHEGVPRSSVYLAEGFGNPSTWEATRVFLWPLVWALSFFKGLGAMGPYFEGGLYWCYNGFIGI